MLRKLFILAATFAIVAAPAYADKPRGDSDYPLEALAKRQQGTVLVDLTVGPDGRAKNCAVLVSSNSPVLDQETCKQLVARAQFAPARDDSGRAVEDHVRAKMSWLIPGCPPPVQTDPRLNETVAGQVTITSLEHC